MTKTKKPTRKPEPSEPNRPWSRFEKPSAALMVLLNEFIESHFTDEERKAFPRISVMLSDIDPYMDSPCFDNRYVVLDTPAEPKPPEHTTLIPAGGFDIWTIREANGVAAINAETSGSRRPDELIVFMPDKSEIVLPAGYSVGDFGEAVFAAIVYSQTGQVELPKWHKADTESGADTQAAHTEKPAEQAKTQDLTYLVSLIGTGLRDHFPPDFPARFKIEQLMSPRYENHDFVRMETRDECLKIMEIFNALPAADRRKALGGWSPEIIKEIKLDELAHDVVSCETFPCLAIEGPQRPESGVYANYGTMSHESTFPVELKIRATSSKAQVLDALEWLRVKIDSKWSRLLIDPKNQEAIRAAAA